MPVVNGLWKAGFLNWLLPAERHQGENSLEAFSLGQAGREKSSCCGSAIIHRFRIFSVSLDKGDDHEE